MLYKYLQKKYAAYALLLGTFDSFIKIIFSVEKSRDAAFPFKLISRSEYFFYMHSQEPAFQALEHGTACMGTFCRFLPEGS